MQVGWGKVSGSDQSGVRGSHQANTDSDVAVAGVGSTQKRWCPPVGCIEGRLNKGTMVAITPALT